MAYDPNGSCFSQQNKCRTCIVSWRLPTNFQFPVPFSVNKQPQSTTYHISMQHLIEVISKFWRSRFVCLFGWMVFWSPKKVIHAKQKTASPEIPLTHAIFGRKKSPRCRCKSHRKTNTSRDTASQSPAGKRGNFRQFCR